MHGNLDLRGRELKNFEIDPVNSKNNISGSITLDDPILLVKPGFITADGTVDYTKTISVKIQNGFVVNR